MARYMDYMLVKHAEAFARLRSKIRSLIVDRTRTKSPCLNLIIPSPRLVCTNFLRSMVDFVLEKICRFGSYLYEIICDVWGILTKRFNRGFPMISSEHLSLILHQIERLGSAFGPAAIMVLMEVRRMLIASRKLSNDPEVRIIVNKALAHLDFVIPFLGLIQCGVVFLKKVQGSKLALCY